MHNHYEIKKELDHLYLYYIVFYSYCYFYGWSLELSMSQKFFFHQKNRVNSKYNELLV